MKKILNRRLLILIIIFIMVSVLAVISTIVFKQKQHLKTSANTSYPYQVYASETVTAQGNPSVDEMKNHINITYDAIGQRLKYLGTAQVNTIGIITQQEMDNFERSEGSYQEGYATDGYYKRDAKKITLNNDIFSGNINSSHIVIGHELIHSYIIKERTTNLTSLVEEGIVEYLAEQHLEGIKNSYPQEVAATKEMLNTFKNLGYTDPDDLLQKIVFKEGIETGINNRLNSYLPAGQTQGAYAYLNSLYNAGKFSEATTWLKSVKTATATPPADANPEPQSAPNVSPSPDTSNPSNPSDTSTSLNIKDLGTITFWPTKVNNLGELITVIINWLLGLMGAFAVVAVVYSGVMYITASNDPTKAETAKKNLTWAIIGIILVALSFVIVQIVAKLISGK